MKLVFQDQAFSFELLRAVGYSVYNGADIGECLATARRITEGDFESWYTEWSALANRTAAIAESSRASGHTVSAREAFLRASNYYRTAEFFLHVHPEDPRVRATWQRSRDCFAAAAALMRPAPTPVRIPYEGTTLPGYLFRAEQGSQPRPTLIAHGGFDSFMEEMYFTAAAAAQRRGYHCLVFDGPGQGGAIREQGLHFRPDWEHVVTPVVDWALEQPEIDGQRLALIGMSQGGYFAPRAAAFEHRLAACIAYDGIFDMYQIKAIPQPLRELVDQGNAEQANALAAQLMEQSPSVRWSMTNGMWTYGAETPAEVIALNRAYTLRGIVEQIRCPMLVCDAEQDQFFAGQPEQLYAALACPKTYLHFSAEEGAEEHCHAGALSLFHQRMFDWLDDTLGVVAAA